MVESISKIMVRLNAIQGMLPDLEAAVLEIQRSDLGVVTKSNSFDLVTRADTTCEARLVEFITQHFSEDVILAEEGSHAATAEEAGEQFLWILDPIDGTTNFANGLPIWGISIGLMQHSKMIGGLVSAPRLGRRYCAVSGKGATCNGQTITVNDKRAVGDGIIGTGFPYDRIKRAKPICRAMENLLREAGGIRRMGAASLDFCFVADGQFSGYYEMGLKPWDYAAGSLIAAEAGAMVTDFHGEPLNMFESLGAVVTNGNFHEDLLRIAEPMIEAASL